MAYNRIGSISYKEYKKKQGDNWKGGISYASYLDKKKQNRIQQLNEELERRRQEKEAQRAAQLAAQHEAEKELGSKNTDVWKGIAQKEQAATGSTGVGSNTQTYMDKMFVDAHGGVSGGGVDLLNKQKENEAVSKATDEWKKTSQRWNIAGIPEGGFILKSMHDSHTEIAPVTTATTETKKKNPVFDLKPATSASMKTGKDLTEWLKGLGSKKAQQEEEQQPDKTASWQDQTAHAANSANPWDAYGSVYEAKAKAHKENVDTTKAWQEATQGSTYMAGNNNLAYAAKMAGVSPEDFQEQMASRNYVNQKKEIEEEKALQHAMLAYNQQQGKTDLGVWAGARTEEVDETLKAENAAGIRAAKERLKNVGAFDDGDDYSMMSEGERNRRKAEYEESIPMYEQQIAMLQAQTEGMQRKITDRERTEALLEAYITPEIEKQIEIINNSGASEEEKNKARQALSKLRQQAQYGADQFLRSGFLQYMDDPNRVGKVRQELYDSMYGKGEYKKATDGMNAEERKALDKRLDDAMDNATNPFGQVGKDLRTAQGMLDYTKAQIEAINAVEKREQEYRDLLGEKTTGDTEWHAENNIAGDPNLPNYSKKWKDVDEVYAILDPDFASDQDITAMRHRNAALMNDDERDKFISLYNEGKKDEAWAFYEALQPMLNQAYSPFEETSINQTARRFPIMSSVATEVAHVAQPVEALINLPGQLEALIAGTENAQTDAFSSAYISTRIKNGVRSQIAGDLGDWGWVYNGFMSGVDSAFNVAIGKGLGLAGKTINIGGKSINALQAATLALFHTQAFETSLQNTLTKGHDNFGYDFIEAWIDAACETATEVWTVENWMADPTNLLRYVAKIAISEPSEEVVGAIVEPYVKEMLGHKNEYKERAKEILGQGGYRDNSGNWVEVKDMDTATRQAMREWNHNIRMAAQEALVSVGPSIVYGGGQLAMRTNAYGRAIQSNNENGENNATRALAEAGTELGEETDSFKQGQKVLQKLDSGKNASNYKVGQLAANIQREAAEQGTEKARQILTDRIYQDLEGADLQGADAREVAGLIAKAIENGGLDSLTKSQRQMITGNYAANNVFLNYMGNENTQMEAVKAQLEGTQTERKARSVADYLVMSRQTNDNIDVGEFMASEDEIREANEKGNRVKGAKGVIYEGQHARLGNLINDNGTLKYQVYTEGHNEPVLVEPSQVRALEPVTAAIVRQQAANPHFYSQMYTNKMLQVLDDRRVQQDPATLLKDSRAIRFAAFTSAEMPAVSLPASTANDLYSFAQAEYIARRAEETADAKRNALKPGKGIVRYKGTEAGTDAFNKQIENLPAEDQQFVRDVAEWGKALGIQLDIVDNADIENSTDKETSQFKNDPSKLYGSESRSGILVNFQGVNYARNENGEIVPTGRHHVGVSLAHEVIHWLQRNTRNGFDELAKYVLNEQKQSRGTQGLNSELTRIMESQDVDLYDAVSELVADSCDNIFGNEEVVKHIAETNQGLYNHLKNFAQDLMNRVKRAMRNISQSMSRQSRQLINRDMKRLGELFNLAWDEAVSDEVTYDQEKYDKAVKTIRQAEARFGGELTAADVQRMSSAEIDDTYLSAVEHGDMETARKIIKVKAAQSGVYTNSRGNPINLYHGTRRNFGFTVFDTSRAGWGLGAIWTTSNPSVASGYSEFGYDRLASSKYIPDDGTDSTIIKNAKNVLNSDVVRLTEEKANELRTKQLENYRKLAELENNASNESPDYTPPNGIESDFWNVVQAINYVLNEDQFLWDDDLEYRNNYRNNDSLQRYFIDYNFMEARDRVRQYFNDNPEAMKELKTNGSGYYKLLFRGYEHGDGIIDVEYSYKPLLDIGDKFIYTATDNVVSRDDLQRVIDSEEQRGSYTLYGYPGDKPFEIDAEESFWTAIKAPMIGDGYFTTDAIVKWAKANGYTSVVIRNVMDPGVVNAYGDDYVFFDSSQLKSADVVTYKDNGDIIKPSERFNDQKQDIRWSMAQPVEETRDLIAYHNIGADQLGKVLRLGGFAMPSIGITRSNYVNDRYGDISVVFYKDTIDPQRSRANKVYGGDAWTPTYPSVEYKLSDKKLNQIVKKINNAIPEERRTHNVDLYTENLTKVVNSRNGDIIQAVKDNTNLMALYAEEKGLDFQYPMREKRLDGFNKFSNDQVKMIAEMLGEDAIREAYEAGNTYDYINAHQELVEQVRKALNDQWRNKAKSGIKGDGLKLLDRDLYDQEKFGAGRVNNLIEAAYKYYETGVQEELDEYAARDALKNLINENEADYTAWLKNLFDGVVEKSGIRNNKNYYTDYGNPRSWEQLHDEETLENVVRVMKAEEDKGANAFFNQSAILALGTKNFKNIDEIRKNKGQLQHISEEEMSAAKENIVNRFGELVDELSTVKEGNLYDVITARDKVRDAIVDGLRSAKTMQSFRRVMSEWNYQLTDAQLQEIADLMNEISNLPTEYFEAKPQRGVGLDEIAFVLVPEGTDQELLNELAARGIETETYDGTSEDRLAKMNEHDDVHFSQWNEETLNVDYWMQNLTPGQLQTEDERALLQAYNDIRISMSLALKATLDNQARVKALESKAQLTGEEINELETLRERVAKWQKKLAGYEAEMYKVTSDGGFANMMYREKMKLRDYMEGKTQEQVNKAVEDMLKLVQQTQEQIRKDTEELKKLAETQAVKTMRSFMGKTSLSKMAAMLRKNYNSTMNKTEIEDRLAEMALKQASGQDIQSDTEALARDILDKMRGIRSEALDQLQGTTLVIGQHLLKEIKAENLTLNDLRSQLKGSGVKLKTEQNSRFMQNWEELRENNQALPDVNSMSESEALHTVIDYIQSEVNNSRGINQNDLDFDEVALVVRASVGNVTTYLVDNPTARAQINNLMKQIAELSQRTEKTAENMEAMEKQLDDVILAGQKAKGWTTVLQRDVQDAIRYYNKTASVAAQVERNKVRKSLIEQLRSEHARKMIQQQEAFREKMKNDRKARELAQDNLALRRKITTVVKRIANLLTKETDLKNIPEQAKPMARQLVRMIANNDIANRMVTFGSRDGLSSIIKTLDILDARDGKFVDSSLDWLIRGEGENADYEIRDKVMKDLIDVESGLLEYRTAEGLGRVTLQDRKDALTKVQKAASEIWNVIRATQTAEINGRRMYVDELAMETMDDMRNHRFKEYTGWWGRKIGAARSLVVYGNMTPEYFIKNLRNGTISFMYDEYHRAENKAGLYYRQAQEKLAQIAEESGYSEWDQKKKVTIHLERGGTVSLNLEQMMQLYATWMREATLQKEIGGTEKTFHLTKGGFYVEHDEAHKIYGREIFEQRSYKLTESDIKQITMAMTAKQIDYVNRIVQYMSKDMSELGNEASMKMYGIKKYNETYYFPFEIWSGVKAVKSDAGAGGNMENHRGAHPSFSNRLRNNASNALMIRGFTQTAAKHIVQMINYNTFAPAIENMQRVMNTQVVTGEQDNMTNRNLWAAFGETYGKDALNYLQDFQKAINGGVNRSDLSFYDRLMSTFRKSAVAGSLSVAAQQPLSYIRASMVISPKYLTMAMNPASIAKTKETIAEMRKYSGLANLKQMGKFDMGIGRSAQQYITPEAKQSAGKKAYNWVSDKTTALPELMDTVTWARLWSAVKMEQQAQNKNADVNSEEFLQKVAERFNEVLRLTQVYDSVLVRSQNMRSTNPINKMLTSFMAEPTLTANVLADAVINAKEQGGKLKLAKAATTFIMSAVAQALVKGLMGAGRNPDGKKTWDENAAYRFMYNFLTEINPLGLIPGYSDMISLMKNGEISDDALNVIGKIFAAGQKGLKLIQGKETEIYRGIEDSVGVIAQLFTNIPVKNLSRDARAMYNFFTQPYAKRSNNAGVLKYQLLDELFTADNFLGALNVWTGKQLYNTSNEAYYQRILNAEKAGNKKEVKELKDYLQLGKGVTEDAMKKGLSGRINKDDDMTGPEKVQQKINAGQTVSAIKTWITQNYKAQYVAASVDERRQLMNELTKMYKLIGVDGDQAMKIVSNWVKEVKKK